MNSILLATYNVRQILYKLNAPNCLYCKLYLCRVADKESMSWDKLLNDLFNQDYLEH